METDVIKIRCCVRKNLFKRLCDMAGTIYYEKYDFTKFFLIITAEEVDKYRQHKNLNYYDACCEYWLYKMFGWTEYNEEKYAELVEMSIPDLYDKISLAYKKYMEKEKLEHIKEDF